MYLWFQLLILLILCSTYKVSAKCFIYILIQSVRFEMLPKALTQKNTNIGHINYGKYSQKNVQKQKAECLAQDKENQAYMSNYSVPTVDLTKKIRKRSPAKHSKNGQKPKIQKLNGIPIYKQDQLGFQPEFVGMIQHQRIDNDVDTDQEQIQSGIQKLENHLREACVHRMYKDQEEIYDMDLD